MKHHTRTMHVYIPDHIFLCSAGAVTTALCAHPSPHIPLQHRCGYNRTVCTSLSPHPFCFLVLIMFLSLKPIDSKPSTQRRSVPVRRYIMDGTYTMGSGATMHILASGHSGMLFRACVDCGLITGCFCEYCLAAQRMPEETWAPNQCTPLCTKCDIKNHGICHFCRGVAWVAPPPHVGK